MHPVSEICALVEQFTPRMDPTVQQLHLQQEPAQASTAATRAALFIQIEIFGCIFTTNSALLGGVFEIAKCQAIFYDSYFNLNAASAAGVIHATTNSVISITKSQFYGNVASNLVEGAGGVLIVSELTHVAIIQSVFHNNSAKLDGGIISMSTVCNLIISQCQFWNNMASKGGVVSVKFKSNVIILDSDFNNNTAYESGGVVSIHEGGILRITNSSFRQCTANTGGILMQDRNTIAIVNNCCSFHHNLATRAGGVFVSLIKSQTALLGCEFINNRAELGGVGMAELLCNVFVTDSSAFNNTASQLGGTVYVINGCLVYVERCQFNGCKAIDSSLNKFNVSGGALGVAHFSKLIMKDCEFYNNTALFGGGVVFVSI